MEKRLKLGISRIFRSSLRSCQSQTLSDVATEPVFLPRDSRRIQSRPSNPPHNAFPSICRPKSTQSIIRNKPKFQNRRSSPSDTDGRRCPPPSPASPFNSQQLEETEKKIKGKKIVDATVLSTSSDSWRFFSSDEEGLKETEPLFSSDSYSSFSSSEYQKVRRRKAGSGNRNVGFHPSGPIPKTKAGKVQESVAVVKSSDDPYGDFRRSMVEMIIEMRMYTAEDLEQLLGCFLSLNSPFHHQVIVEVFSEILEALFPNCS